MRKFAVKSYGKMSELYFDSALNSLQKPQDKVRLLKILVAIRKEIDFPKNKDNLSALRQKGCLKNIVICLQNESGSILDVTLSILGNCCLDKNCARELVKQYNVLSNLGHILKRNVQHDSINGRIFRIIGNICQHWDGLWNTIMEREPQIVQHIVQFLNSLSKAENENRNFSDATVNMAIRALRSLCHSTTVVPLIISHGVLKAAGLTLIKYTEEWKDNKSNEEVLTNIIRLLQEYSRYNFKESISELRNTDKGDSLLCLGSLLTLAPQRVIDVVMNFIKIATLKSDLPIPGICKGLINGLQPNGAIINDYFLCKQYLECLGLLLEHPGNRENVRNSDSINLLLNILNEFNTVTEKNLECIFLLISPIRKCLFDETFTYELLQGGIVNALTEKLEMLVGALHTIDIKHDMVKEKKRCRNLSPEPKRICRSERFNIENTLNPRSPPMSDDDFDCYTSISPQCYSPSSGSELSFDSHSSPSSPFRNFDGSSCDSDDYSPVCSEVDENEVMDMPDSLDKDYKAELPPEVDIDSEEESTSMKSVTKSSIEKLKCVVIVEVAKIIKILAVNRPVIVDLASVRLLTALIKCEKFLFPDFLVDVGVIMSIILESHEYLLPLMQTDFIPMVYESSTTRHGITCGICSNIQRIRQLVLDKLSLIAESGCGRGDIAHKLLRGDMKTIQKLVIVIPYVIRNKTILKQLMINCRGVQILMKLMKEEHSDVRRRTVQATCVMASKLLGIKNPVDDFHSDSISTINADLYTVPNNDVKIVTFKLEDDSRVKADRDFLTNSSEYFSRLLNGHFKESQEEEVLLTNVKCKSLKCLLNLLKLDVKRTDLIKIDDVDLATLLDVIILTDRYLLEDLNLCLVRCVEQFCISAETVPTIYQWSLESGTNLLRIEVVAFALVSDVCDNDRFFMFQNIYKLGYIEQLTEDIRTLLVRYLNLKCR